MRGLVLLLFFCYSLSHAQNRQCFSQKYPKHYCNALNWLSEKYSFADSVIRHFGLETQDVLSIGLPECSRFSDVSNFFECTSNHYFYVTLGSEYSNFSVGRFQMKPSFIEQLEKYISNEKNLSAYHKYINQNLRKDEKITRKERLARLASEEWQLIYLCAVYSYLEFKYKNKKWLNKEEKIEFFALAYNRGFWHNEDDIFRWKNICLFPSGRTDSINNYTYGEVALEFLNYLKNLKS